MKTPALKSSESERAFEARGLATAWRRSLTLFIFEGRHLVQNGICGRNSRRAYKAGRKCSWGDDHVIKQQITQLRSPIKVLIFSFLRRESEVVEEIILPCDASTPAPTASSDAQDSEIDTKNAVADSDEIAIAGDTISNVKMEDLVPCEERLEEEVFVRESTPPVEEPAKERPSPESQDENIAASPCPSVPDVEVKIEPDEQPEMY